MESTKLYSIHIERKIPPLTIHIGEGGTALFDKVKSSNNAYLTFIIWLLQFLTYLHHPKC